MHHRGLALDCGQGEDINADRRHFGGRDPEPPQMPVPPSRLAKFSPPRSSRSLLRPRLHAELDALSRDAVVWIAAGPGSGKSTLAATWASERGDRTLWYRVDEADADPASAFDYFAQLAATVRRGRGIPGYRPQDAAGLAAFARSFFRAFFSAIPAASTLVVDDAHAAGGEFATLLAAAIREAPHDVRMIVLGREAPTGIVLDEVARGAVKVLDAAALAFTPDEAVELLVDQVDPARARAMCARAGGWAGGLLLLAQSPAAARGEGTQRDEGKGEASVAAYFSERVLGLVDPGELRELSVASLLPDVDVEILERTGLGTSAQATLERLRERHAFVTRLERERPTWKLHDLLRDTLQARFDSLGDPAWRKRMLDVTAGIAAERGLVREAVRLHFVQATPTSRSRCWKARPAAWSARSGSPSSTRWSHCSTRRTSREARRCNGRWARRPGRATTPAMRWGISSARGRCSRRRCRCRRRRRRRRRHPRRCWSPRRQSGPFSKAGRISRGRRHGRSGSPERSMRATASSGSTRACASTRCACARWTCCGARCRSDDRTR